MLRRVSLRSRALLPQACTLASTFPSCTSALLVMQGKSRNAVSTLVSAQSVHWTAVSSPPQRELAPPRRASAKFKVHAMTPVKPVIAHSSLQLQCCKCKAAPMQRTGVCVHLRLFHSQACNSVCRSLCRVQCFTVRLLYPGVHCCHTSSPDQVSRKGRETHGRNPAEGS